MLSAAKHLALVRPFRARTRARPFAQFILSEQGEILRFVQNDS
jgi:hypothetical protein